MDITIICLIASPSSHTSINSNDTPLQLRIGTERKSTGDEAFITTKAQFNQPSADDLRSCENEENGEDLTVSNSNSIAAEHQYIAQRSSAIISRASL
jgi:hypothetical protein